MLKCCGSGSSLDCNVPGRVGCVLCKIALALDF